MTAAVTEKLGCKWITTNLGKFGIHTTRKRLIQVQRGLKAGRQPFRAFEVFSLGRYIIAVKVIDIFGNDTMSLMPVTAG